MPHIDSRFLVSCDVLGIPAKFGQNLTFIFPKSAGDSQVRALENCTAAARDFALFL